MKRGLLVVGLVILLSGTAEASMVSDGLRKTWGYLFAPVNAVANLLTGLGGCVLREGTLFVTTVLSNANPGNLVP